MNFRIFNYEKKQDKYMNWIKIFSALSDEIRLRIFLLLLRREFCVCELVKILGIEQSRVSHSLKELYNAGLVLNRKESWWNIYFVNPEMLKNKIILAIKSSIDVYEQDAKNIISCSKNVIERFKLKNKKKNK